MRDAAPTPPLTRDDPAPGLLQIAGEAMLDEFRQKLAKNGYEGGDLYATHGCVFRFVEREDGMRLTELAAQR